MAILVLGTTINLFLLVLSYRAAGFSDPNTWARLAWIVAGLLYVLMIGRPGQRPYLFQQSLFLGAASLSLFFAAIITGLAPASQGGTFVFIINLLLTSTFLTLSLPTMLGITLPSIIYLASVLFFTRNDDMALALTSTSINITAVTAFAIMVSHFLYRSRHQRFIYEVMIRRHNTYLENLATLDGLTGVANRHKIDQAIANIERLAEREQLTVGVIMADLDNFKAYNDACGHLAGDELLKAAAQALKDVLQRDSDLFGRYGGEEFIAILPTSSAAGAYLLAERMRHSVRNLNLPHPGTASGFVTVSLGVAGGIPTREQPISALILQADQALYRAKQAGKNRVAR